MSRFNHILFPVDFSRRCSSVRPFVELIAQRFHSKLTLMHVVQIPTGWYGGMDGGYPILCDEPAMKEAAMNELNSFVELPNGFVNKVVEVGDPAFEIIQYAEQNEVDLIMVPTHGYGKFRTLLLGSVTAKVLHDAKCPVWTATHTDDPDLTRYLDCKNVMGAIDVTPDSVSLIHRYADVARGFNAKLRLVHAVLGADADLEYGVDRDIERSLLQRARGEIARLQAEAGTDFEVCLEGGPVAKIVRAAALHHDADLVMLGRGTLQERFGQLRTNAYAIIRDSPCPVLSV